MIDLLLWPFLLVAIAATLGFGLGCLTGRAKVLGSASTTAGSHANWHQPGGVVPAPAHATSNRLEQAASWGYQLLDLDVDLAVQSPFDLLVLDRTKDRTEATALLPAEIARLKRKPDGSRRLVLASCSIGEAEAYRSYWRPEWERVAPEWLLGENPEWEDRYAVCFWHPGWRYLIAGSPGAELDRIIAQGFDGVLLDNCCAAESLRRDFPAAASARIDLEGDMVDLVRRVSDYARARQPGFYVLLQNAEALLERSDLRRAVDGVVKEELLFGLSAPEAANHHDAVERSRARLDLARHSGKPVFVVEYLASLAKIEEAATRARLLGYRLYVSSKDRELDHLVISVPTSA